MLRNARRLEDFELRARDGRIGHVTDFFFDDRLWTIRYFVVDAGSWLDHREVLIAPASVRVPAWDARVLPVDLTCEQVRQSPPVDPADPVSREQELQLIEYYNWPLYWSGTGFPDPLLFAVPPYLPHSVHSAKETCASLDEQHHIRSVEDVRGYTIEATDGDIGHVDDFLIDEEDWTIRYLVVDTRNWWPGKRVLVAPDWIYEVGWDDERVLVDLSRDAIRHSPSYDPAAVVSAQYTDQLHAHYREPRRSAEP